MIILPPSEQKTKPAGLAVVYYQPVDAADAARCTERYYAGLRALAQIIIRNRQAAAVAGGER